MASKKGKHQTVAKEVKQSIAWLEGLPEVKRCILGLSEPCRHKYAPGTLRVRKEVLGGLSVNAYGGNGITDVYLHISPPESIPDVSRAIERRYG